MTKAIETILVVAWLIFSCGALAQQSPKRVKLIHTDELRYDRSLVDAQRLIGSVHLEFDGTQFYCDSAYLFTNDDFDAFSHIRILDRSGGTVASDFLHFDKAMNTATLRDHVVLRDKDMTLTSNDLIYHVDTEIAHYSGGGKIVSTANKNTLTSKSGTYNGKSEIFYFKRNVVLRNPSYVVNCDTMQYNSNSEVTFFHGPTTIVGDSTSIYCENGYYNSKKDESRFGKRARITDRSTVLKGDSLFYNGSAGIGEVFGHVYIRDTTQTFEITGDYGKHIELSELNFVTGHAMMTQDFEGDTLFMHADTLRSLPDSAGGDRIFAFHGVRMFKSDLQATCDSLVYLQNDSSLWMYASPVLWSSQNQVIGDTIMLKLKDQALRHAYVYSNAFIASDAEAKGDSIRGNEIRFNQIKGKQMRADFANEVLHQIDVQGNGELVYFPTDDKEGKPKVMGSNEGQCSSMLITFKDGELSKVRMDDSPKSIFKSNKFASNEPLRLSDFKWLSDQRPRNASDIFRKQ